MNETPESLKLNHFRKPMKECRGEFLYSRNLLKAMSPLQGIHSRGSRILQNEVHDELNRGKDVTNHMEKYTRPHSASTVQRRHSLSHLPSYNANSCSPTQLRPEREWNGLGLELSVSLPACMQRQDGPGNFLREQSKEPRERNLELELRMMQFELLSLKQKMRSSFAHLEKEKMWLEMACYEDRKQNGNLDDKIIHAEMELAKTRSYLGSRTRGTAFLDSSQKTKEKKKDVDQKLITLQESSVVLKKCLKALQKERDELAEKLKSAEEEKNQLSAKVISLDQKVNELTLKLTPALSDREQLLQVNRELSSEVAESCQRLGASLEKLHHLEAENKILNNGIQALENEHTQLLGEIEGSPPERQLSGRSQQEDVAALQESCECLRKPQSLLQIEKISLQTRCLELEAALQQKQEEMVNQLTQQQQVSEYWRGRWEEVTANLKTKEEELEEHPCQTLANACLPRFGELGRPLSVKTPLLLQIQLDACKLELERNCSQTLQHQIQLLQSRGQNSATNEASLEKADPELALVREELQKVWDMLKTRDMELEEQQLELESVRSQYTECNSEKQKLEQLVTSLEKEIAKRDQALMDFKQVKDTDRTELEVKISSLEKKVAEMKASQEFPDAKPNQALQILKGQKNGSVSSQDNSSWDPCSHCSAALLQLNKLIQSYAEKSSRKQEEEATLTFLYQVQDLLKGKAQDQNLVSILGQRQTQKPNAKICKTPQKDQESLRQQQQLVTEQLKGLFRQRKQLKEAGWKKQPGGPKEEALVETPKSQDALATPESMGLAKEGQPEAPAVPGSEVQNLQQQLKEKTETINSMASEIQALQEKNETLVKAKLRFQQQIQKIRKLPKQYSEKGNMALMVPKLTTSLEQDLQNAQWSDCSVPSPQSDDTTFFSHSREGLIAEDKQSVPSYDNEAVCLPLTGSVGPEASFSAQLLTSQTDPSEAAVPSIKLSFDTPLQDPQGHADTEVALVSPGGSALLSPRPFGLQRPWSPFKFKGSSESLEK